MTDELIRVAAFCAAMLSGAHSGAQPAARLQDPADDPFSRRSWYVELGTHGALETWNYNISHEELYGSVVGVAYGLGKGVVLTARSPLYYVSQRGVDGLLFGGTIGVRSRVYRRPRWSLFWELEIGISQADTFVPPRGTRFNYLVLGGGGTTIRLRPGVHLMSGVRWIHVSNAGVAGRDRNPDIEAVGLQMGVLFGF
jgi:hypothetical protein